MSLNPGLFQAHAMIFYQDRGGPTFDYVCCSPDPDLRPFFPSAVQLRYHTINMPIGQYVTGMQLHYQLHVYEEVNATIRNSAVMSFTQAQNNNSWYGTILALMYNTVTQTYCDATHSIHGVDMVALDKFFKGIVD
ncbi:hypothetical protein EW145_g2998 [Phellinidium pouzarii]|uniref:Uncharacterized protein n=1 Tax=Phellinidium pouzarii TaxID=167371 RepID=A0A4S4L981_9AGAM|nr:hypothetical protein EW145_g2998 [Phellinidium pouzarii]